MSEVYVLIDGLVVRCTFVVHSKGFYKGPYSTKTVQQEAQRHVDGMIKRRKPQVPPVKRVKGSRVVELRPGAKKGQLEATNELLHPSTNSKKPLKATRKKVKSSTMNEEGEEKKRKTASKGQQPRVKTPAAVKNSESASKKSKKILVDRSEKVVIDAEAHSGDELDKSCNVSLISYSDT